MDEKEQAEHRRLNPRKWVVLYRDERDDIVVVEKFTEKGAERLAAKKNGTYQETDL